MKVCRKNYSSGESLSELLVASLIISIAMITLFSGVKVGTDIMGKSRENYQAYNDAVNSYEKVQADYLVENYAKYNITPVPEPPSYSFSIGSMDPHK